MQNAWKAMLPCVHCMYGGAKGKCVSMPCQAFLPFFLENSVFMLFQKVVVGVVKEQLLPVPDLRLKKGLLLLLPAPTPCVYEGGEMRAFWCQWSWDLPWEPPRPHCLPVVVCSPAHFQAVCREGWEVPCSQV